MIRVVVDTNLLISYLLTQGPALSQVVAHWEQGDFVLLMSPLTLAEIKEVAYRPRLRRHMAVDPQVLLEVLDRDAEPVAGTLNLTDVCRDPKDDKFIACAVEGNADYIVTGDADLLVLGTYQNVQIIQPGEFLQRLQS